MSSMFETIAGGGAAALGQTHGVVVVYVDASGNNGAGAEIEVTASVEAMPIEDTSGGGQAETRGRRFQLLIAKAAIPTIEVNRDRVRLPAHLVFPAIDQASDETVELAVAKVDQTSLGAGSSMWQILTEPGGGRATARGGILRPGGRGAGQPGHPNSTINTTNGGGGP